jgi:hypothetical protein
MQEKTKAAKQWQSGRMRGMSTDLQNKRRKETQQSSIKPQQHHLPLTR